MRASSFTSVDFPAPFSPTMATTDPAGNTTDTSSSTARAVPGYEKLTCSKAMPVVSAFGAGTRIPVSWAAA